MNNWEERFENIRKKPPTWEELKNFIRSEKAKSYQEGYKDGKDFINRAFSLLQEDKLKE